MKPKVEKKGEFFWDIFEKTGSIEAFLLYHKSKHAQAKLKLASIEKALTGSKSSEK